MTEPQAVRLPKLMEQKGNRWVLRDEVEVARELSEVLDPQLDWVRIIRSYCDPEDTPFEIEGRLFKWSRGWGRPVPDDVMESPR